MSDTETIPEPDWLAAQPTARAKLTAIFAAVRRCQSECWPALQQRTAEPTGPHLSTTMAELFIGQLLIRAAASEREACAQMAEQMGAGYYTREAILSGGIHPSKYEPFADLLREPGDG